MLPILSWKFKSIQLIFTENSLITWHLCHHVNWGEFWDLGKLLKYSVLAASSYVYMICNMTLTIYLLLNRILLFKETDLPQCLEPSKFSVNSCCMGECVSSCCSEWPQRRMMPKGSRLRMCWREACPPSLLPSSTRLNLLPLQELAEVFKVFTVVV